MVDVVKVGAVIYIATDSVPICIVELAIGADVTGITGAIHIDIAIKQTITEEIAKAKGKFSGQPNDMIHERHLEAAMRSSRKSVSEEDLLEYFKFAIAMKAAAEEDSVAGGTAMASFSFKNNTKKGKKK